MELCVELFWALGCGNLRVDEARLVPDFRMHFGSLLASRSAAIRNAFAPG
jgi:hypothetical protein